MALGLTGYEARVYLALIGRDRYTAAQVARESGVPRQRIYDVLAALTERGLVRPLDGRVVCYTAVDPASAIERLMAAHRASFSRLESTTTRLVEELVPLWSSGRDETDPLDYVEVIRDGEVLMERWVELHNSAQREVLSVAKAPYQIDQSPVSVVESVRRVTSGGGRVRALYDRPVLQPEHVGDLDEFADAGEEARIAESTPMRMLIIDGTHVLMSLRDPVAGASSMTSILIEHPALAASLTITFETIWAQAVPLAELVSELPSEGGR